VETIVRAIHHIEATYTIVDGMIVVGAFPVEPFSPLQARDFDTLSVEVARPQPHAGQESHQACTLHDLTI
jgi:hypothetical protein